MVIESCCANRRVTQLLFLTFLVAVLSATDVHAAKYTILDLGQLNGETTYSSPFHSLNALGQVTGSSITTVSYRGFRTAANQPIEVSSDLGGRYTFSYGINDAGQVVGSDNQRAFRTAPNGPVGTSVDLGTFGGSYSHAYGINFTGQTVGYAFEPDNQTIHAFRTSPNGTINPLSDLGTLGGSNSFASVINDSGQTVGSSDTVGNAEQHAFRTSSGGIVDAASDLGTLGGKQSFATDINASGQAVGASRTAIPGVVQHAFRTEPNGKITAASDLGAFGAGLLCQANAINSWGQTVGNGGDNIAFFADVGSTIVDLNSLIPSDSGWVLTNATGINDSGQIAGDGIIAGEHHVFLLNVNVPEPSCFALTGVVGSLLIGRRRCRRVMLLSLVAGELV